MKTITVAEAAKDFTEVLAAAQSDGEEVVITQDGEPVATLIPEHQGQTLEEIFADPADRLGEEAGAALAATVEQVRNHPGNRLSAQRKPWAG